MQICLCNFFPPFGLNHLLVLDFRFKVIMVIICSMEAKF